MGGGFPLSIGEAAAELRESEEHIEWLIREGRLPNPPTLEAVHAYKVRASRRGTARTAGFARISDSS